jgi:hypothetical protein
MTQDGYTREEILKGERIILTVLCLLCFGRWLDNISDSVYGTTEPRV